jgi:hypothetical protein
VDVNHPIIAKTFEKEVNSQMKGIMENQLTIKRPNVSSNTIFTYFSVKDPFEKDDV